MTLNWIFVTMIIYIILINHKIWSVALLILIVFFNLAQCCEIGGHLRSIVLPSDAMWCNNRNRKWVLRHFLPFHQVVQSLHGGRHLGTTGTTRLKTNALYYCQSLISCPWFLVVLRFSSFLTWNNVNMDFYSEDIDDLLPNSLPTCHLLITFANSLDPYQAWQNDLDPNWLIWAFVVHKPWRPGFLA